MSWIDLNATNAFLDEVTHTLSLAEEQSVVELMGGLAVGEGGDIRDMIIGTWSPYKHFKMEKQFVIHWNIGRPLW